MNFKSRIAAELALQHHSRAGRRRCGSLLLQVVAVGSGRMDEKTQKVVKPNVQAGSTVLYSKYSGTEFQDDDDREFIVVRESDIIATLS